MIKTLTFIEGDFIEDINGVIFDVKGFEHPNTKVIAFPRYIPHKAVSYTHLTLPTTERV